MTTLAEKAEHVRRAATGPAGAHHCHWPGCARHVPPAMWGCQKHWFRLPRILRARIWRAYRPGQEVSKTPSSDYVTVARDVQAWIAEYQAGRQ